jgi:S1-C subfamily serine protease
VEHTYFLQGLNSFETTKAFKHNLNEVEAKLMAEGIIGEAPLTGKAKIVSLWAKYKRNIAVAASIAGFISLLGTGVMVSYTKNIGNETYRVLVDQVKKTERDVQKLKQQNASEGKEVIKTNPEVDFRATGFLIDGKGYLVTNAHVISRMKNIYIENKKGDFYKAEAVYSDKEVDLAILKIIDTAFKALTNLPYSIKKGNSDLGEQFFTLGFPRNEIVYGEGYLSAKSGNDGDSTAYQLTVSANPGNSGGPVINRNGEIIGVITAKDSKADGVVYAAKSKNIISLVEELKKTDDKYLVIKTPTNSDLKGLDRVQQVKKMEEFIFMVVGN